MGFSKKVSLSVGWLFTQGGGDMLSGVSGLQVQSASSGSAPSGSGPAPDERVSEGNCEQECPICLGEYTLEDMGVAANQKTGKPLCNHIFCKQCIKKVKENIASKGERYSCGMCRGRLENSEFQIMDVPEELKDEITDEKDEYIQFGYGVIEKFVSEKFRKTILPKLHFDILEPGNSRFEPLKTDGPIMKALADTWDRSKSTQAMKVEARAFIKEVVAKNSGASRPGIKAMIQDMLHLRMVGPWIGFSGEVPQRLKSVPEPVLNEVKLSEDSPKKLLFADEENGDKNGLGLTVREVREVESGEYKEFGSRPHVRITLDTKSINPWDFIPWLESAKKMGLYLVKYDLLVKENVGNEIPVDHVIANESLVIYDSVYTHAWNSWPNQNGREFKLGVPVQNLYRLTWRKPDNLETTGLDQKGGGLNYWRIFVKDQREKERSKSKALRELQRKRREEMFHQIQLQREVKLKKKREEEKEIEKEVEEETAKLQELRKRKYAEACAEEFRDRKRREADLEAQRARDAKRFEEEKRFSRARHHMLLRH